MVQNLNGWYIKSGSRLEKEKFCSGLGLGPAGGLVFLTEEKYFIGLECIGLKNVSENSDVNVNSTEGT